MRDLKTFFTSLVKKPPQLFPLVTVFLLFSLGYSLWNVHTVPFPAFEWLQPAWMTAYIICWIGLCDMRKWAAWSFIALVTLNLVLYIMVPSHNIRAIVANTIFPIDILFGFFVLFYYKRYN